MAKQDDPRESPESRARLLSEIADLRGQVRDPRRIDAAEAVRDANRARAQAEMYLDIAGVMLVGQDARGLVTYANRMACDTLGYARAELLNRPWIDGFIVERLRDEARRRFDRVIRGEEPAVSEYVTRITGRSGSERVIRCHSSVARDGSGAVVGTLCSCEDITEQLQTASDLAASEAKFRAIFEDSNVAMGLATPHGQITDTNRAMQEMLGYTGEELRAMQVIDCIHPDDRARIGRLYRGAAAGRSRGTRDDTRYLRKDGSSVWGSRAGSTVRTSEGEFLGLAAVIVDVTERRRDEQALREHRARLQLVNEIARGVRVGMSAEEIVTTAVDLIAAEFPTLRVVYGVIDSDGGVRMACSVQPANMPSMAGLTADLAAAAGYLAALRDRQPVVVEDVRADPRVEPFVEAMTSHGTRAVLDVPIHDADGLVGILCFDAPDVRVWSDHETATLLDAGGYLAIAFRNAATQRQLAGKTRLIDSFEALGKALLSTLDLDHILDTLAREVLRAGVFRSLTVALVDEDEGTVEVVRGLFRQGPAREVVTPHGVVGRRYELNGGNTLAEVARTGRMEVTDGWDPRFDTALATPDTYPATKVAYFIPVIAGDRVPAVLATASELDEKADTLRNIDAMGSLLGQVAIALEHARAYEAIRSQEEELRRIVAGARCLLWHAEVTWEPGADGRAYGLRWDIAPFDEASAREFVALDPADGESYWQAFNRSTPAEHRVRMADTAREALLGGCARYTQEYACVDRHGATRWVNEDVFIEPRGKGRWRLVGVCTDITDRKRREEEARHSNAELERLVQARTADLTAVNQELQDELRRHEETEASLHAAENDRRRLVERILTVQEHERAEIARELHDQAGQSLSSVLVGLQSLRRMTDPAEVERHIDALRVTTGRVLDEVRTLSFGLRPPSLDEFGLVAALDRDVETFGRRHEVRTDFIADETASADISPDVEAAVYRVVHAALANTRQHAEAENVSVVLRAAEGSLHVVVEDDGVGFDVDSVLAGPVERRFGLLAMQERLHAVDGTVEFEASPDGGSTVFIRAPMSRTRAWPT